MKLQDLFLIGLIAGIVQVILCLCIHAVEEFFASRSDDERGDDGEGR